MLKKITSYLIAISLIVTTIFLGVPTNVNAEELKSNDDARKQIMLGTDGLKMWREQNDVNPDITINPLDKGSAEIIKTRIEKLNKGYDYIWYGKTPTRWRLLDKESTNEKDKNGLLLLSNNAIKDNEIFFNPFEKRNDINVYQGSELQKYIKNYGENNFTDLETKSMMETYKSDPYELSEQGTNYEGGTILKNKNYNINNLEYLVSDKGKLENILAGDKLFPLSVKEASNNEYGFVMDDSRWVFYDECMLWVKNLTLKNNSVLHTDNNAITTIKNHKIDNKGGITADLGAKVKMIDSSWIADEVVEVYGSMNMENSKLILKSNSMGGSVLANFNTVKEDFNSENSELYLNVVDPQNGNYSKDVDKDPNKVIRLQINGKASGDCKVYATNGGN